MIKDAKKTIKISKLLNELGLYVPAIRPPTVPIDSSRLRVSISALHSEGDIKKLAQAINEIVKNEMTIIIQRNKCCFEVNFIGLFFSILNIM